MTYEQGYEQGLADYVAGLQPLATRLYSYDFRIGYSDGYHAASGGKLTW